MSTPSPVATDGAARARIGRHARVSLPPPPAVYNPSFDGLRTIAVYLVVAFHSGWSLFGSGYVGVDIFFVLSGFLITGLLLREYRSSGHINLARFYARRIRRLLPASLVVLTLGLGATLLVAGPLYRDTIIDDARASMLWVANWHFINVGNDYFAGDHTSPFIHFWSLAVEEQFYLFFPALILAVFAFAARKRLRREGVLILAVAALLGLSVALAFIVSSDDPLRAYYGTETRIYQLLAGALLALLVSPQVRSYNRLFWIRAQWIAIALIAILAVGPADLSLTMRGVLITAATVLLILALDNLPSGPFAQVLSKPAMSSLGRVSYGTYLWHMPVIYILVQTIDPHPILLTFAAALTATGLAYASARFIEQPVRKSAYLEARPGLVIVVGIGMSVVLALAVLPRLAGPHTDPTELRTSHGTDLASVDWASIRDDTGSAPECDGDSVEKCLLVNNGDDALKVNIVGDSHAVTMLPALTQIAKDRRWTLSATVLPGCPWQWGVIYPPNATKNAGRCAGVQKDWYESTIPALDADVNFMVSIDFADPNANIAAVAADENEADWDQKRVIATASARAVDAVRATGSQVIFLKPVPFARNAFKPLDCLSDGGSVESCTFTSEPSNRLVLEAQDELVGEHEDVWQVDLDRMVCPDLPTCSPFFGGTVVRRDNNHVTATFWMQHRKDILEALEDVSENSAIAKADNGSDV